MKIAMAETRVGGAASRGSRKVLLDFALMMANQRGHQVKYDKPVRPAEAASRSPIRRDCGSQTENPAKRPGNRRLFLPKCVIERHDQRPDDVVERGALDGRDHDGGGHAR